MAPRSRLIARRRVLGRSKTYVAQKCDVHPETYSRWEAGTQDPRDYQHRDLAAVLEVDLGEIPALLLRDDEHESYPSPVDRREFLSASLAVAAVGPLTPATPPVASEMVGYFSGELSGYWQADRAFGPHLLLDSAVSHCQTVLRAARTTRGKLHQEFVQLGVAFTGLVSWLYQDAGDLGRCSTWLNETLELAHRTKDPQLIAYALSCKAMVYADAGDGVGAVDLASAALDVSGGLCAKARVMAMQHAAFGHALLGDRLAVDGLLDQIGELLEEIEHDDPPWGGDRLRRTPAEIVDVQRATCYERLGVADEAAPLWQRVMRRPATERRDRGVHLARQASALVDVGEADKAAERAAEGLRYLHETGSARMQREFVRLQHKATQAGARPVQEVLAAAS